MPETIQVSTSKRSEAVDITDSVRQKVRDSGVQNGLCVVYVPHTTAGVMINEGADPAVMTDVLNTLDKLIPWNGGYKHAEGNSAAHIKSVLVGNSVQVIVDNAKLLLGTWQHIFLCEFDGPRTRKIYVKTMEG